MLEILDLNFAYNTKDILKRIRFRVNKGQILTVLGANGCGKTTLLKCLNGIHVPQKGQVLLDGIPLNTLKRREIARLISMVPQEKSSYFSYLVQDVIVMGATPRLSLGGMPNGQEYRNVKKIMDYLGITYLASQPFNQLSEGEKQLVLIARSLLQDTDYIIMDEPTSNLDFKNQFQIMAKLRRMADNGCGVIIALHDPNLALKFSDQIIILSQGKIVACGETEEVITEENLFSAYQMQVQVKKMGKEKLVFPREVIA